MRRILLASVPSFLLIASLSGCQEDPEQAANKLFVETSAVFAASKDALTKDPATFDESVASLRLVGANLDKIVSEYPESTLAVELVSSGAARQISREELASQITVLEEAIICRDSPEDLNCTLKRVLERADRIGDDDAKIFVGIAYALSGSSDAAQEAISGVDDRRVFLVAFLSSLSAASSGDTSNAEKLTSTFPAEAADFAKTYIDLAYVSYQTRTNDFSGAIKTLLQIDPTSLPGMEEGLVADIRDNALTDLALTLSKKSEDLSAEAEIDKISMFVQKNPKISFALKTKLAIAMSRIGKMDEAKAIFGDIPPPAVVIPLDGDFKYWVAIADALGLEENEKFKEGLLERATKIALHGVDDSLPESSGTATEDPGLPDAPADAPGVPPRADADGDEVATPAASEPVKKEVLDVTEDLVFWAEGMNVAGQADTGSVLLHKLEETLRQQGSESSYRGRASLLNLSRAWLALGNPVESLRIATEVADLLNPDVQDELVYATTEQLLELNKPWGTVPEELSIRFLAGKPEAFIGRALSDAVKAGPDSASKTLSVIASEMDRSQADDRFSWIAGASISFGDREIQSAFRPTAEFP